MIGVEMVDTETDADEPGLGRGTDSGAAHPATSATSPPASGLIPEPVRKPRPVSPRLAAAVQRECLRRGLIVELGGRHAGVVRLLPPLTITDEQAAAVLDRLADAVAAASRTAPTGSEPDHPGEKREARTPQAS